MEDYYRSAAWQRKRQQRLQHDQHTCQGCGITRQQLAELGWPALQVHHRNAGPPDYRYPSFGHEPLSDLLTLCSECHDGITNSVRRQRFKLDPRKQVPAVHVSAPSLAISITKTSINVRPPRDPSADAGFEPVVVPQRTDRRSAERLRQGHESRKRQAQKD
jgi:hypothetical protein